MNFQLQGKHVAVLLGLMTAIGTQISGMQHGWHDAMTPQYVGGLLLQIATTLGALFVTPPAKN